MKLTRRKFLALSFGGLVTTSYIFSRKQPINQNNKMTLILPSLNYAKSALAPYISEETLEYHYGKHHQAYVDNGNKLLAGSDLAGLDIKDIIVKTAGDASKAGIFNNAAQVWNHSFYWDSMKPNGGGLPSGPILDKINQDFGSYENFKNAFTTAGATQFGSGWAWLVVNSEGKLEVTKTANADNPLTKGQTPLATMDVWEHAYYIDYRNARPKYMETFLSNLINWDFVNANLEKA
jgi:superoxide dismutase, Fe-Mn family